nr:transposase [Nocardioides ferulae]
MAAPRKYPDELRERATRMAVELRADPATKQGAIARVAEQLGMHPETLRNWVRQAEVDGGVRPGTTTAEAERIAKLEQENRELRRANHILRTSAAYVGDRCQAVLSSSLLSRASYILSGRWWPWAAA